MQVTKTARSILAVGDFNQLERFREATVPFFNYYEEVDASQHIPNVAKYFQMTHPQARLFRYFETKNPHPLNAEGELDLSKVIPEIQVAVKPFSMTNVYNDEYQFVMCESWSESRQIPFNEVMGIYTMMFFLGSLVRYQPAYLEAAIESTDSWIIERFVNSCTTTFLRHINCLIANHDCIYFAR